MTGLPPEETLADCAARAVREVARRLDRDLAVGTTTIENLGSALRTSTYPAGDPGPVVHLRVDESGDVSAGLELPADDPWGPAARAVAEMLAELTGALLSDPGLDPAEAPALSKATEARVLGPLAGTAVDHGPFTGVPAQLVAGARATPDAIAVYAGGRTLTYRQLVSRARDLAAAIRNAQPTPGSLVPVVVADGPDLPVAWSAAMFAGIGYVPVDPRWPAQRIEHILDVLPGAPVVCTDPTVLPEAHRARAIMVGSVEETGSATPAEIGPEDVVYGVFTSGTTGAPMCAVNQHRGVANRLAFMNSWFGPPPDREVVLQNTRHTYDSAFWQVFWPLTTGGAVVVPTVGDHHDLLHTIDLIEAHGVTVTDFVPAVLHALLMLLEQRPALAGRLRSLRHLVVGGEQMNPHDVHRIQRLLPGLRVSNGYGPSEAAIGMIFHEVTAADGDDVPLGRPIDNCAAVVVDVDGRPLPPGATGEIVIGGACVGLGYHGRPERTAQRFFDCPWPAASPVLAGRMYRTGDLGHVDDRGRFHFSGRIDHQIKVGGVRIEPGEIEAAALSVPGVRQAVALVSGGDLLLFVTGSADARAVLADLRAGLPRTSVPQRCLVLDELPLTEAGKTDRRRLATLAGSFTGPADGNTDPVLGILRSTLRRPDLADSDDIVAAGVNSLQAVAAVVALTDHLGVELGVKDLFENPTAAALRALLDRHEIPDEAALVAADLVSLPAGPKTENQPGPKTGNQPRPVRTILLTGATGFIGARLLSELLTDPELRVVCLVRGQDDAHARRRLGDPGPRVRVVAGDLGLPGLGLDADRWRELTAACDLVLHNGAMVNFLYDYRMHRDPNVRGTAEVIRFAREAGGIPVHYVSSLGVLHDHALLGTETVPEDVDLTGVTPPASGYSLSKWVAERLLHAAADLPVTVLRLGEIMPAADGAGSNAGAVTQLLLTAFDRLGAVPDAALRSDWTPVDVAARAVVATVRDRSAWGRAAHVFHPETVRFDELTGDRKRLSCLDFLDALRDAADPELNTLLAIVEHRAGSRPVDEQHARDVLENLLQDNPRHFAPTRRD
ncbi:non-ribosomal peptide synthetase [Actinoplanes couchii]|uniref:Carrier domain-containing protein n=1 Tax=Actinoplanes couchii TaxID=403638 RepID=A0ABQ3XCU5_9ACTN|nr:amino acid adenylation domain-containing protein [Actinoplanes couchii]MDR6321207.1 amino acid adenylation domain-containing protein/thioester reductase-like protein [Actinoplanes couchii]GID56316.1 hypothetical protein Aco03nite_047200 [Actinoplanes couchii]